MQDVKLKLSQRLQALQDVESIGQESAEAVELDQSRVGRLSRMDALQSQAMSVESNRRRKIEIQKIKSALRRVDDGEYGLCVMCGEEINVRRLEIDIAAAHCIDCANKIERHNPS